MEHRPNPENSVGPLVGIIIIVLVLVLGGLYFWGERFAEQRQLRNATSTPENTQSSSADNSTLITASTSAAIEYR